MTRFALRISIVPGLLLAVGSATVWAAAPSVSETLKKYKPVQAGVSYDIPDEQDLPQCTIKAEKINGATAWVIRDPQGRILRQYADTNGNNHVDTWRYFESGLEVYRDIDSDHNGKPDQYRWFHAAGMKWGIDENEDRKIDSWKLISAEEAAEEAVEALRTSNLTRFQRLLVTPDEAKSLGLSEEISNLIQQRLKEASTTFRELSRSKDIDKDSEFRDFGGLKPGMVPKGTRGSSKDVLVYENVWAMIRNGEKHEQIQLGTMLNVKGAWKLIDGPVLGDSQDMTAGIFFVPAGAGPPTQPNEAIGVTPPNEKAQEILTSLEKLDEQLVRAKEADKPGLNAKRARLLEELARSASSPAEKRQWYKQLADMVSAATQVGNFPEGIKFLRDQEDKLSESEEEEDLIAYFQFHRMRAEHYGVRLMQEDVDYAKAQSEWLEDLENFVDKHPRSEHGVEALRELALGTEMMGQSKDAAKWYQKIASDYPKSSAAPLAKGALTRMNCVGRGINLRGTPIRGDKVDLQEYRGKAVVIQYWTTSCDVCRADQAVLKELVQKYGGRKLMVVGVNLDYSRDQLLKHLKATSLPWPQLYEEGGFESRYAQEMGVVTVPLLILVGPNGKVVDNNIQAAEIEDQLKDLFQKKS